MEWELYWIAYSQGEVGCVDVHLHWPLMHFRLQERMALLSQDKPTGNFLLTFVDVQLNISYPQFSFKIIGMPSTAAIPDSQLVAKHSFSWLSPPSHSLLLRGHFWSNHLHFKVSGGYTCLVTLKELFQEKLYVNKICGIPKQTRATVYSKQPTACICSCNFINPDIIHDSLLKNLFYFQCETFLFHHIKTSIKWDHQLFCTRLKESIKEHK